jgi:hypothetical protein
VKSYLEAVENVIRRINVLLSAADGKALRKNIAPLLKRYRAKSGKDEPLLQQIISAFRVYPAAYDRLHRELSKANPNRWPGEPYQQAAQVGTVEALDVDVLSSAASTEALSGAGLGSGSGYGSGASIGSEISLDEEVGAVPAAPATLDEGQLGKKDDAWAIPDDRLRQLRQQDRDDIDSRREDLERFLRESEAAKKETEAPPADEEAQRRAQEEAWRRSEEQHRSQMERALDDAARSRAFDEQFRAESARMRQDAAILKVDEIEIVEAAYRTARVEGANPGEKAAPPDRPRWLLACVYDLVDGNRGDEIDAFRAETEHEVEVWIGYEALGKQKIARGPTAEYSVDGMLAQGEEHQLTVVLFIPALGVQQSAPLALPPSGPSRRVRFRFAAGPTGSAVDAMVAVVHKGRVLQTALLAGNAVPDPAKAREQDRITLRLQVVVPGFGNLGQREAFGATVVAARDPKGRAMASAVSSDTAESGPGRTVLFDEPPLDKAVKNIRRSIGRVVGNPDSFRKGLNTKPALKLLWQLAQDGALLHEVIGARLERELAGSDLSRLQIVQASADAFVPLEFVYDLLPPGTNAKLCPNWKQALAGKPCSAAHHPTNDALNELKVVCPSGFWSVSKVIERQVLEDVTAEDLQGHDFGVRAEPGAKRTNLSPSAGAVFAWSEILDNAVPTASRDLLQALTVATGGQTLPVKTWTGWAGEIDAKRPGLLVLLSHTVEEEGPLSIEIGAEKAGERRTLAQINEKLVKKLRDDAPIVLLLGCDTGVAESDLTTFVGRFRDKGAAVVVGTITPVLGEHSAAVVEALLGEINAAAAGRRGTRTRFGDIMLDVRRQLLAQGELTALCVAAFGDADWRVGRMY